MKNREHVTHNMAIAVNYDRLTVGTLKRMLRKLKAPDDLVIKGAEGIGWRYFRHSSVCRTEKELSLW